LNATDSNLTQSKQFLELTVSLQSANQILIATVLNNQKLASVIHRLLI